MYSSAAEKETIKPHCSNTISDFFFSLPQELCACLTRWWKMSSLPIAQKYDQSLLIPLWLICLLRLVVKLL